MRPRVRFSNATIPLFLAVVGIVLSVRAGHAQFTVSLWNGGTGNWSNAAMWSTNPFYPQDGNPAGTMYNAGVSSGAVTLDIPITISRFGIQGGTVTGTNPLTLSNGMEALGGTLSAPLVANTLGLATNISNLTVSTAGSITGNANVTFMGPLSTINGPYNVTGQMTADFNAPGVNFNGPTRMGSLLQRYPIGGTGDITVTGNFTWSGDEIRGSGPMTVQGNSSLIGAFFSLTLTGRTLRLQGPSNTMTASGLTIRSGGELQIAPGATLDVASGSGGVNNFVSGGGAATINNAGTFEQDSRRRGTHGWQWRRSE